MPKVRSLDRHQVRTEKIVYLIKRKMEADKITQTEVANELGISQQALSSKFQRLYFTLKEIVIILDFLQIGTEEAIAYLCRQE